MKSTDKLVRQGKPNSSYRITFHSHWSDIVNENDPNDVDSIKWLGNDEYVSASKGFTYKVRQ